MTALADDIAWAKQALTEGRSMAYIASVLEISEREARSKVFGLDKASQRAFRQRVETFAEIADREDNPRPRGRPPLTRLPDPGEEPSDRRRALLRRRFARNWDMIWFLRRCGMAGRTLRNIYGAEALIWSVGGGIDTEIGV